MKLKITIKSLLTIRTFISSTWFALSSNRQCLPTTCRHEFTHNEHTRVHESSQPNNNISDSNHYEQSYVRDSPRYDDNNYSTINQEYQHPQQQQANQNIHQEIKYVHIHN